MESGGAFPSFQGKCWDSQKTCAITSNVSKTVQSQNIYLVHLFCSNSNNRFVYHRKHLNDIVKGNLSDLEQISRFPCQLTPSQGNSWKLFFQKHFFCRKFSYKRWNFGSRWFSSVLKITKKDLLSFKG